MQIWTIGHSTHPEQEFMEMLEAFQIEALADVRRFPGSRRYPQFSKDHLSRSLQAHHIGYYHFEELGGRRKSVPESVNTAWRNASFRGYADYMQSAEFKTAIGSLETLANKKQTAYMCSEALWWSCHRSLISDYLKWKGWTVLHIMGNGKIQEHPYTSAATIENGELQYHSAKKDFQGRLDL